MTNLAPDTAVAVKLIARVDLYRWRALSSGLMNPTPYIHASDAQRLEDLLAWIAAHSRDEASFVQAAVWNVGRVLADLSLVLNYNMEPRDGTYMVFQWYRLSYGRVGHQREVEEWCTHVALIHNLSIELTRAINLVIERARRADKQVLAGEGAAVIETGPTHAPMEAVAYSPDEAAVPEPYPGLEEFPHVMDSRAVGGLGFHPDETPRKVREFDDWITHLVEHRGRGSDPPPPGTPPFSLPRPASPPSASGALETRQPPIQVRIAYSVILAFAAIGGVIAYPWLAGAAIGDAIVSAAFHRRVWRWPPQRGAVAILILAALAGGVVGELIAGGLRRQSSANARTSPAAQENATRPIVSTPGTGQIVAGNHNLVIADLTRRSSFQNHQRAQACDLLQYRVRIYNPGPGDLSNVRISASVNTITRYSHIVPTITVYTPNGAITEVSFQATIDLPTAQTQAFVPYSTQMLNSAGQVIKSSAEKSLEDGITASGYGINIGAVDVGVTEYILFRTELSCQ